MNSDVADADEEICGESYDHDLQIISERDGWITFECRRCGAEIQEENEG